MDNPISAGGGPLLDLSEVECWDLAATKPVGRLAWCGPSGPSIVPVNFTVADHRVHIRTAAYSSMARECDDSPVAFEIDELDEQSASGWSVLIRGRAHVDFEPGDAPAPDVWPDGTRALHLTVEVNAVTGRRVLPA